MPSPATELFRGPDFAIQLVNNNEMERRWAEIEAVMQIAFADSTYIDDEDPIAFTRVGVEGQLDAEMGHALAIDDKDGIIGGIFCLPQDNPENAKHCDVGWVFTAPDLTMRKRLRVLDGLVLVSFNTIRRAGYEQMVTNMGTEAGAKSLSRRYGIVHAPTATQPNRWTSDLTKPPSGPLGALALVQIGHL